MIFSLIAKKRERGEVDAIRAAGSLPAVVYGPQISSTAVVIPYHSFEKLYDEAGESNLVDFTIEGDKEPMKVLIQDVQYDPVTGRLTHVDFRQINMKKEMTATIELVFVSESSAVKELGGTLIKALSDLRVKCLPKDLVGSIDVDLNKLKTFADTIRIGDLVIPAGITVVDSIETVVAKVAAPLTEDQLKAMEEGTGPKSLEEIEVVEKKKEKEGEEGEEGAEGEEKGKEKADDKAKPAKKE